MEYTGEGGFTRSPGLLEMDDEGHLDEIEEKLAMEA